MLIKRSGSNINHGGIGVCSLLTFCPSAKIKGSTMKITINSIEPPKPADEARGYKGRESYKITDTNGNDYFAKLSDKTAGLENLKSADVIDIDVNKKEYGGKVIAFLNSFSISNGALEQLDDDVYEESKTNDLSQLTPKDWLIWIQACSNRHANWSPDQKLKWGLKRFTDGPVKTFNDYMLQRLDTEQEQDLDNTALSQGDF